jgi:hypothetical protein
VSLVEARPREPPGLRCWRMVLLTLAGLQLLGSAAIVARAGEQPPQASPANDFPTVERVLFVEACARERPDRSRTEMLYKCSCVIDVLAGELSFEEYVNASTAFNAAQAAGERGTRIRESSTGRELADRFRAAQAQAAKRCMLAP